MKYFELPHTDLNVSQIALGCMRISEMQLEEVETLIEKALSLGINFFDHADIYGNGKCEELFGQALAKHPEWREQMIIQTKCGIVRKQRYDFSKEHILSCVNESLKRLQVDYIDIVLLHRPDALCDPEEVAQAFNQLIDEGKVRYIGVSNHTPGEIELLQSYLADPLIINQLQLSIVHSHLIDSSMTLNMSTPYSIERSAGVLDYCRLKKITIQPWSPLQATREEGSFIDNPHYEELNKVLDKLAKKYLVNKSAIAIAWLLRHPAHMQPIVGTTSIQHLQELADASKVTLTRQEWYDLYLASGKILP